MSVGVFGVLAWSTVAGSVAAASSEGVHFPAQVDGYSWWTSAHSWSNVGDQVVMMYQNGVGVETMDSPQAVMLAADGITYRRIDAAEALTVPADQGDPAATVLSPDGTVLVIAGANRHGFIEIVSLADDTSRRLSIGDGRSAMPLSIAADGTVVLLLSDTEMSPYLDYAALAALVVWLVTPRRPKCEDHAPAEQLGVRPIPERAEVHAP